MSVPVGTAKSTPVCFPDFHILPALPYGVVIFPLAIGRANYLPPLPFDAFLNTSSTSDADSSPSFRNSFARSVTTPATARPPAMVAAFTGSTPAKAPTPTLGRAKDMNSASERSITSFITCSVIVVLPILLGCHSIHNVYHLLGMVLVLPIYRFLH